jgi:SAM-dependent methyltransferase
MNPDSQHLNIREQYGKLASSDTSSCCGQSQAVETSRAIGYSDQELAVIPDDANLGLGCGNPTAIAAMQPGETVLDLGSGAGMDAFLAAKAVTPTGRVIGVDMTPEMLQRARKLAVQNDVASFVEFREGMIEDLPVVSGSVDVVISNCVINLSPEKQKVFNEAYRVLKPGGRLAVSDICLSEPLPASITQSADAIVACIGGASLAEDYLNQIKTAGFIIVDVKRVSASAMVDVDSISNDPILGQAIAAMDPDEVARAVQSVWSYRIEAKKA